MYGGTCIFSLSASTLFCGELQCRVIEKKVGDRTMERNVVIMVQGKLLKELKCLSVFLLDSSCLEQRILLGQKDCPCLMH